VLPLVLNPGKNAIGLAGAGEGLARRAAMLAEAGVEPVHIAPQAGKAELQGLAILFVAGLSPARSGTLAARARAAGVLVNVEDQPALCDFHVPAAIRRGDLLVTVSTGGKAPGLAKLLRQWIERRLGLEWDEHLAEVASARVGWRQSGVTPPEVSRRTAALVEQRGWLA
jgi:precorrin-2 dehydrogenase/sirohydrochlorin ferrochelatase